MNGSTISKLTPAQRRRLERLRQQTEGALRKALDEFLATARSDAVLRQVLSALEKGDVGGVLRVLDPHIKVVGERVAASFATVGRRETAALAEQLKPAIEAAAVTVSFRPDHPRAAALMEQASFEFVQEFSRRQREVTRAALTEALQSGAGPRAAARVFRDSVGLTLKQRQSVQRYRRLLETGAREALERELRDRRFDRTIDRAIRTEEPLSAKQINTMVGRYQENMVKQRTETIARTETTKVLGAARREAQLQVFEQAKIPDGRIRRTWRTNLDGRERESHHNLNGETIIGMNSRYSNGLAHPGDPTGAAEEIINCRCDEELQIAPPTRRPA